MTAAGACEYPDLRGVTVPSGGVVLEPAHAVVGILHLGWIRRFGGACHVDSDDDHLFRILRGIGTYRLLRTELGEAEQLAEHLTSLAEGRPPGSTFELESDMFSGVVAFYRGAFSSASQYLERAIATYSPDEHHGERRLIDAEYVQERVGALAQDQDLSRYIL